MKKIGIILGSASDLPVMEKAICTLREFEVPLEVHIFSAHRTPDEAAQFAASARENGFGVLIAAAGMAAHLAGALAARTTLPVIGVPMSSATFQNGMDALLYLLPKKGAAEKRIYMAFTALSCFLGCMSPFLGVLNVCDAFNGLMALLNVPALFVLTPQVFAKQIAQKSKKV